MTAITQHQFLRLTQTDIEINSVSINHRQAATHAPAKSVNISEKSQNGFENFNINRWDRPMVGQNQLHFSGRNLSSFCVKGAEIGTGVGDNMEHRWYFFQIFQRKIERSRASQSRWRRAARPRLLRFTDGITHQIIIIRPGYLTRSLAGWPSFNLNIHPIFTMDWSGRKSPSE